MEFAEKLSPRGMRLVVNDRADIAAIAGAGGVHVGQEDLPVEEARRICGPSSWVGVSTHNLDQLREAAGTSADYIAVGPIFPTATKENPDPRGRNRVPARGARPDPKAAGGHRRHHIGASRGCVSRGRRFGGRDSRSGAGARSGGAGAGISLPSRSAWAWSAASRARVNGGASANNRIGGRSASC